MTLHLDVYVVRLATIHRQDCIMAERSNLYLPNLDVILVFPRTDVYHQVVEQHIEHLIAIADMSAIFLSLLVGEHTLRQTQQLGKPIDGIDGGTNLVAHIAEESLLAALEHVPIPCGDKDIQRKTRQYGAQTEERGIWSGELEHPHEDRDYRRAAHRLTLKPQP